MDPFDHQTAALQTLQARATAYFRGGWHNLELQPRWATLITGPTGVGKTTLVKIVAARLGANLIRTSAPAWIPAGAHNRGVGETLPHLIREIEKHDSNILFLDEMEKLGDSPWMTHCRDEIWSVVDGILPSGIKPTDEDFPEQETSNWLEKITNKLRRNTFIVGAATFQTWFDSAKSRRAIGFTHEQTNKQSLTADVIAERIPREFANRFQADIQLKDLEERHYRLIIDQAAGKIPASHRTIFREEAESRLAGAIEAKKAVRFVEEAWLAAITKVPLPEEAIATSPNIFDDPAAFEL
jgi:energy-coupling factor transporter ATP-binding protein EcfA2